MKPRHLRRGFDQLQLPSQPICRSRGYSKHTEATRVAQRRVTFLPMAAANRIDHEIDAATIGELLQYRKPIPVAIVDCVIESTLAQKLVLARTRRAEIGRASC